MLGVVVWGCVCILSCIFCVCFLWFCGGFWVLWVGGGNVFCLLCVLWVFEVGVLYFVFGFVCGCGQLGACGCFCGDWVVYMVVWILLWFRSV